MEDKKTLTISVDTAICAARHIVAAHESWCTGKLFDWGMPCQANRYQPECSAPCRRNWAACNNVLDWQEMLEPIFAAAGIYPQLARADDPGLVGVSFKLGYGEQDPSPP